MTRLTTAALKFGLLLASIVVVAVILEVGLSFAKINTKSNVRFIPGKGAIFIPNSYYLNNTEGFSEGHFNSHGFRDYDRTYKKDPGTFRILVLGDSYVEALQVAMSDAFPAILEKRLNGNPAGKKFEVLAMGLNGSGTAEEYMRYQDFGLEYSPDMVMLAFLTGNDFLDNSRYLSPGNHAFYFYYDENRKLVLDRTVVDNYEKSLTLPRRMFQTLKQHSYLANLISEKVYLLREDSRLKRYKKQNAATATATAAVQKTLDPFSPLNIYVSDPNEHWKEAFDITRGIILKFRDSVEEHHAKFVLVSLTNAEQVHPDSGQYAQESSNLPLDFAKPDQMIEEFAKQNGISYLKLLPVFQAYHLKSGKYLHGFGTGHGGHWNENGHCLAAETIFAYLKDSGLVSMDSSSTQEPAAACGLR